MPNGAICKPEGKPPLRRPGTGSPQDFISSVKLARSDLHASTLLLTDVAGVTAVSGVVTVGMGSGGPSGGVPSDSSASAVVQGSSVVAAAKSSSSLGP